jgi:hypothetical protein
MEKIADASWGKANVEPELPIVMMTLGGYMGDHRFSGGDDEFGDDILEKKKE